MKAVHRQQVKGPIINKNKSLLTTITSSASPSFSAPIFPLRTCRGSVL